MIRGQLRALGVIVVTIVLLVLALLAWSDVGVDPLEVSPSAKGLTSITWAAQVGPDGRLAVEVTYDFDDDVDREFNVRVPDGARYLRVDDEAVQADNGVYTTVTVSGQATVGYELPGRVTRYRDGSLLHLVAPLDASLDGDEGMFPCPRCGIDDLGYGDAPVYGILEVVGAADTRLHFTGLRSIRDEVDDDTIRFVGIDPGAEDVALLAVLSADATPELTIRDGTVGEAFDTARDRVRAVDESLHAPADPDDGPLWLPLVYSAAVVALVVWLVISFRSNRRPATW